MDIKQLVGIGEKQAALFHKLKIYSTNDLLMYYPRTYQDRTKRVKICDIKKNEWVCVEAVVGLQIEHSFIRKGLDICKTRVFDDTGELNLVFFNATYVKHALKPGETYVFFGKLAEL